MRRLLRNEYPVFLVNTPEHWRTTRQFADWFTNRSSTFVRLFAYAMIGLSFYLFALAAYDEHRGVAAPPIQPGSGLVIKVADRDTNPQLFHGLMHYEWTCPVLFLLGGCTILGIVRWADRCDPFSPSFAGKKSLEDCERALDHQLENFHRPLRD